MKTKIFDTVKFTCEGNNAPAYSCNKPNDQSGEYVKAETVKEILHQNNELLKLLKTAQVSVEILINHIPTGRMRNILTEDNIEILSLIEKTENRCKHNIKMLSATIGFCKKCDKNINLLSK